MRMTILALLLSSFPLATIVLAGDIVKVTQYLTRAEDIPAYANVRSRFLGDLRPAFMLLVVSQLVWPKILLEVEIIAAKA